MHFFTFNIGDWNKKTGHLSLVEEFVYFKLVCFCYETELPIPHDTGPVIRKLRLQKHAQVVTSMLSEFFILSPDGWINKRCAEELEIIYKKSEKARDSVQERWRIHRLKNQGQSDTNVLRTNNERNTNVILERYASDTTQDTINTRHKTQDTNNTIPSSEMLSLFSDFWTNWPSGYGDKGSRKNAEREFLKIKPDKELITTMRRAAVDQFLDKQRKSIAGQFVSNFKHIERWLKNREWENEIEPQRPVRQSRDDHIEAALEQAFGNARSEAGILEGDFQTVDSNGPNEQANGGNLASLG